MANFDARLFWALALGPDPDPRFLAAMRDIIDGLPNLEDNDKSEYLSLLTEHAVRKWSKGQRKQYQQSKDLLYALVMLRAASMLRLSSQDPDIDEAERLAEASLSIRLTSRAADRSANQIDGATGHETPHTVEKFDDAKAALTSAAATDHGFYVSTNGAEDVLIRRLAKELGVIGLSCPPK